MKVYIMYEVAGAMGYADSKSVDPPELRRIVTAEVNAAIAGAAESGAKEFLVNTGCPPCNYILQDEIDERADVVRGVWKPDQTMAGLDESFDALFLLSMHAKAGTPRAVWAHTWSLTILDYRVNGVSIGELGMAAYFAAACGVRTALVSGDSATCAEAKALLGDVEVAPTKESISWISARCPHPSVVLPRLREGARRAMARLPDLPLPQLGSPVTVELDMSSPIMIPWWLCVPGVEATGPCGIRFQADDYRAAHRLFVVLDKLHSAWEAESGLPM